MAKSYFAILGISSGATADEIRSAYRRLAKEFHPDHYTGDSEIFRDILLVSLILEGILTSNLP